MNITNLFLLIGVMILVFLFLTKKTETVWKRTKVLITGLSSSGKTKLFYKLTRNLNIDSITSFSINEKVYEKDEDTFKVVDIPGHASFERDLLTNIEKGTTILFLMNEDNDKMISESCQRLYQIFITKKFQDLNCEMSIYLTSSNNPNMTSIILEQEIEKEFRRIIFSMKSKEYQGNEDSEEVNDYIKNFENFKMSDIVCRKLKFDLMDISNTSFNTIFNQS